jgi:predicted nucleic acid-binding protein
MRVLLDATTLIALGQIGETRLLECLDGEIEVPDEVRSEVTTEPARTNTQRFCESDDVVDKPLIGGGDAMYNMATDILEEPEQNGDVAIIANVLTAVRLLDREIGVVSDNKRVRTVADGLGATVTGTVGVIVRAVEEHGMTAEEGKDLVRRVDSHGLHMTGELREKAYDLVEEAAEGE